MSHLKIPKSVVIRIMKVAMGKRKLFARFVPRSLTAEHREDRVAFSIFKNSWILMMGQIGCPETTVRNYFYSQLNNPGQRRSHLLLGGSLKSHLSRLLFMINIFVCIRQRLALIMYICLCIYGPGSVVGIAISTSWTDRGSNPGGGEIFRTYPDRSCGQHSLLYNGYRVFPGGKLRLGREADPSRHVLVPSRGHFSR